MQVSEVIRDYNINPAAIRQLAEVMAPSSDKRILLAYSRDVSRYTPFGLYECPNRFKGDQFVVQNIFEAARDHAFADIVGYADGSDFDPTAIEALGERAAEQSSDVQESEVATRQGPDWLMERLAYAADRGLAMVSWNYVESEIGFDERNFDAFGWRYEALVPAAVDDSAATA